MLSKPESKIYEDALGDSFGFLILLFCIRTMVMLSFLKERIVYE